MTTASKPIIRKQMHAEIKSIDATQGIIEAYVNSLGVIDADGDVIMPGAFTRSIARGVMPAVCWMHDWKDIVGQVTEANEVETFGSDGAPVTRLLAKMQFDMDDPGAVVKFHKARKGMLREWSVGFYSTREGSVKVDGQPARGILDLDWAEVSPVLRGASPDTGTLSAKAAPATPRATKQAAIKWWTSPIEGSAEDLIEDLREAVTALLGPVTGPFNMVMADVAMPEVIATFTDAGYCIVQIGQPDDWDDFTYWKIPFTIDAAGDPVLGEPESVQLAFLPVVAPGDMGIMQMQVSHTETPAPATSPDAAGTEHAQARLRLARTGLLLAGVPITSALPPMTDTKRGARNSAADQRRIQDAYDLLGEMGATCPKCAAAAAD